MKDGSGRKVNYLRLSVTDLCNLRCIYCMPEKGIKKLKHDDILRLEEIESITKVLVSLGIDKIRITGGEPLLRKGVLYLIQKIAEFSDLKEFCITSNGTLLGDFARPLKDSGIDRINISLDTLDKSKYAYITRGGKLSDVLNGITAAQNVGFRRLKLNIVLIKGFNDNEIEDFVNLTKHGIDIRFIELMPIGSASVWSSERFFSNHNVLQAVKSLVKVHDADISSPAVNYRLPGAEGVVGLISPITCKFCKYCNRARLTSDGRLLTCLHSERALNLKDMIRNNIDMEKEILEFIRQKPLSHNFEKDRFVNNDMVRIGG